MKYKQVNWKPAPEIGALALAGDADAVAAVHLMLQSLATVAANAAITLGARAGIVIAGGIVPKLEPLFATVDFLIGLMIMAADVPTCSPYQFVIN